MALVSSFGVKCSIKCWLSLFVRKSRAEIAADVISPVKKTYLMLLSHSTKCTHELFQSHRWSTMATSTLQDPLMTLSGWSCYPGGFKLEPSIKNNKLSSLHLTELLLASSLNQMERILLQSQSAVSLPNFKQFNSYHSSWRRVWFLFPRSEMCPVQLPFLYGLVCSSTVSPGHFTVKQLKSCQCRPTQRAKPDFCLTLKSSSLTYSFEW